MHLKNPEFGGQQLQNYLSYETELFKNVTNLTQTLKMQ